MFSILKELHKPAFLTFILLRQNFRQFVASLSRDLYMILLLSRITTLPVSTNLTPKIRTITIQLKKVLQKIKNRVHKSISVRTSNAIEERRNEHLLWRYLQLQELSLA